MSRMRETGSPPTSGVPGARINANGTIGLRPAAGGDSQGASRHWIGRLVAAEHACAPLPGYALAIPSHLARSDGSTYACPECGQVFATAAPEPNRLSQDLVATATGASNVIPFPVPQRRCLPGGAAG